MVSEIVITTDIKYEEKHIYFCKRAENGTIQVWKAKAGRPKKKQD